MDYRPAERLSEILRAWEIVHDAYVREGLLTPRPSGVYYHPEALTNRACVAVAVDGGKIVATAGAILDGPAGLPLDVHYKDEIDELRTEHSVVEFGVIASEGRRLSQMAGVITVLWWWAQEMSATALYTSCHPDHARYYVRAHGLHPVGPVRSYHSFSDAPVVMLVGVCREIEADYQDLRGVRYVFANRVDVSRAMEPRALKEESWR